jgi:aminopeptidase N
MADETKKADETKDAAAASKEVKADKTAETESSQKNPVKEELERVKKPRSQLDKLKFKRQEIDEQIESLEGTDTTVTNDDDKPLTKGEFKKMQMENSKKSSLQLADDIGDEDERNLVKHYLNERIVPSGNPTEDLRLARSAVNSVKNGQLAEDATRNRSQSSRSSSGSGAAAKTDDASNFQPTELELRLASMSPVIQKDPSKLKEWILNVRKKEQQR